MYRIRDYPNGGRLITRKMEGVSSVSLGLWFNTGSRNEAQPIGGISHFLEHLVFKGSKKYTGDRIKESVEGVGGTLNAFTSEENTCYYAKFPGRHLKKIADVLGDMVLCPLLRAADIEKERTVILEEIKMYKDLPQYQVQELFDGLVWPGHPLGRNIAGEAQSVSLISRSQIQGYHRDWYTPASLVVSCAGDLDIRTLEGFVENVLAGRKRQTPGSFEAFSASQGEPRIKISSKPIEQTHINLGFPAFSRSDSDRFILGLIHVILGGNMSSRLFNEVREKKGLAYEIATHAKKLKDTGVFFVHAGIDNRKLVEATRVIFKELNRICREKVSSGELRRAKDFYIGQTHMALDDCLEHMMWMGDSLTNLGFVQTKEEMGRAVQKVDARDILRVARRVFHWDRLCFAAVGPQDNAQEGIIRDLWSDARARAPREE